MTRTIQSLEGYEFPKGTTDAHFAAIGRFVCSFAQVEVFLHFLLRDMLGLEETISRALLGEARAGDLMSDIKRISLARKDRQEIVAATELVFGKIGVLKDKRDHVAHRLFAVKGEDMAFHNQYIS